MKKAQFIQNKVSMLLNKNIDSFDEQTRKEFLERLASLTGCEPSEFRHINFRSGCVIFSADIDEASADRIKNLFEKFKDGTLEGEDYKDARTFFVKYDIMVVSTRRSMIEDEFKKVESTKPVVFLIHGWRGGESTFSRMKAFLDSCDMVETKIYSYPSQAVGHSPGLSFVSQNFENFIRNTLRGSDARYGILAHSMGGIVTRDFVSSQLIRRKRLDEKLCHITFFASPLTGNWMAPVAERIPILTKSQIRDLSPNSHYLSQVTGRWHAWRERNPQNAERIHSIYGTHDSVVPPTVAQGDDPEAIPILGANHTSVLDPDFNNREVADTVMGLLKEDF